jgi:predicted TPR repeat methyltransferase
VITRSSLDAAYFDGIFEQDDDPWNLATSNYEKEKFEQTISAIADRRYTQALEVGCAHGVLTGRLVGLCDRLLAIDISSKALEKAHHRVGDRSGLSLQQMAFPKETPDTADFDLIILSEVVYYWGVVDLDRAGEWLKDHVARNGRIILVHYIGETDYPHSGDDAVDALWAHLKSLYHRRRSDREDGYRLDLWERY